MAGHTIYRGHADVSWADGNSDVKELQMGGTGLTWGAFLTGTDIGKQVWCAEDLDDNDSLGLLITIEKTVSPSAWPTGNPTWTAADTKLYFGGAMHDDLVKKFKPVHPGSGHPYGPNFWVYGVSVAGVAEVAVNAVSTFLGTGGAGNGMGNSPTLGAFGFLQGGFGTQSLAAYVMQPFPWRRVYYTLALKPTNAAPAGETHTFRVKVYERYMRS